MRWKKNDWINSPIMGAFLGMITRILHVDWIKSTCQPYFLTRHKIHFICCVTTRNYTIICISNLANGSTWKITEKNSRLNPWKFIALRNFLENFEWINEYSGECQVECWKYVHIVDPDWLSSFGIITLLYRRRTLLGMLMSFLISHMNDDQ